MRYKTSMVCALILMAAGQASATSPADHVPNTEPDFSGTWERYPDDWYGDDPDHPVLPGGPFDLKMPYAEQYAAIRAKAAAADAAGTPLLNASSKCLPEGMPLIMGAIYPIEIVQNDRQFVVLGEFLGQTRRVWLNDQMPPLDDINPTYNGHAVGHWEGDTLVISTKGVREDVTFYDLPHGKDMTITERIQLSAPDRIRNEVTIDDPQTLNKPYHFTFEYKKTDYRIQEYVCERNELKVDEDGGTVLDVDSIVE